MNEHMWKKLGEVKAFADATNKFLTRGEDGFVYGDIFSADEIKQLSEKAKQHSERINDIALAGEASKVVDAKAEATGQKLNSMQDLYLAHEEDWSDPMELLEWSGFFFGGAVIHWNLIRGVAESVHYPDLTALAEGGYNFYTQMLDTASESIHQMAKEEVRGES